MPSESNPRSARRWLVRIFALLVLATIYFLPQLLVYLRLEWAEKQLSQETDLKIDIGYVSAGWFAPIEVGNVNVDTPDGMHVLDVSKIRTEKSLLGLMLRGDEVGGVTVEAPSAFVPLEGSMLEELKAAAEKIDPTSGLLGKIVNPARNAILRLEISDGRVAVRPTEQDEWKPAIDDLTAEINIDHTPELDSLDVSVAPTTLLLSPEVSDYGLKFVAPVLAGAVDLDGRSIVEVQQLKLQPQNWKEMELSGTLNIEEANANIEAKLIRGLVALFSKDEEPLSPSATSLQGETLDSEIPESRGEGQGATKLAISNDSEIRFSVINGVTHHEGLSFAFPDVLPNVRLTSVGNVGFDESLDFEVGLTLPFEKLGEGPLLQKIGTPSLKVPIKGTFKEPDIGIGEGKMFGGLVRDVVDSLSDGQVDVDPLMQKIKDLEILKKRREKKSAEDNGSQVTGTSEAEGQKREGILGRLRSRLRDRKGNNSEDPDDEK